MVILHYSCDFPYTLSYSFPNRALNENFDLRYSDNPGAPGEVAAVSCPDTDVDLPAAPLGGFRRSLSSITDPGEKAMQEAILAYQSGAIDMAECMAQVGKQ